MDYPILFHFFFTQKIIVKNTHNPYIRMFYILKNDLYLMDYNITNV
jgi:hypothetical protein